MNTISAASPATPASQLPSWTGGIAAVLRRGWLACMSRRIGQAAIAELCSMSDQELKDIGVCRCEIELVVFEARPSSCLQPL